MTDIYAYDQCTEKGTLLSTIVGTFNPTWLRTNTFLTEVHKISQLDQLNGEKAWSTINFADFGP
jgi:hypothetical protein